MGFVLAIGIPGTKWDIVVDPQMFRPVGVSPAVSARTCGERGNAGCWRGTLYTSNTEDGRKEGGGLLMQIQIYTIVAFATVIIKGLLSMHSLLENPFGTHPCKFPLRFYNIDHIRQTRAFLREPEAREPPTVRAIFVSKLQTAAAREAGGAESRPAASTPDALLMDDGAAKRIRACPPHSPTAPSDTLPRLCAGAEEGGPDAYRRAGAADACFNLTGRHPPPTVARAAVSYLYT